MLQLEIGFLAVFGWRLRLTAEVRPVEPDVTSHACHCPQQRSQRDDES